MKKVDFVIAGTQKGGTTALWAGLIDHPQLCFTKEREGHFFNQGRLSRTPITSADYVQYHQKFTHAKKGQLWGDKTPGYMYFEEVPGRIWEYNSQMKVIVILRNPIDRAYSQYQMQRRHQWVTESFAERLDMERALMLQAAPRQIGRPLIARGYYVEQIRRLQRFFPDEQLLFLRNEQLRQHPRETLEKTCTFLKVDPARLAFRDYKTLVPHREYPPIGVRERTLLSKIYYYEIKQLEVLLDWDCRDWLEEMEKWL